MHDGEKREGAKRKGSDRCDGQAKAKHAPWPVRSTGFPWPLPMALGGLEGHDDYRRRRPSGIVVVPRGAGERSGRVVADDVPFVLERRARARGGASVAERGTLSRRCWLRRGLWRLLSRLLARASQTRRGACEGRGCDESRSREQAGMREERRSRD